MQVLCGLQVVFFLFNCQTPVIANRTVGIPAVTSKCENNSNSSGYAGLKYCGKSFPISIFVAAILSTSLPRNLEILYHMPIILYFYPLEKPVYEKWEPSVIMSFSNDYLRYKEWNES